MMLLLDMDFGLLLRRICLGDPAGGWRSAISADVKTWTLNKDGSYTGIIYTIPDRG